METKGRDVGGIYHGWSTSDSLLEGARKLSIRDEDIWIITFPKAGTTWTQELMSLLLNGCNVTLADEKPMEKRFLFLDFVKDSVSPHEVATELPSPRLIKTHFQSHQMPRELTTKQPKIVYVGRNPKDNAVSLYHFHRAVGTLQTYESWNEFLEAFIAGRAHGGSWFEMNLYWWSRRHDTNVFFLKYEDLHTDFERVAMELSMFLGCTIPEGSIHDIVSHCSFATMKNNPKTNYTGVATIRQNISPFMRKGIVGDWKNYFTVAQNEEFNQIYTDTLKGSGLVFEFEL